VQAYPRRGPQFLIIHGLMGAKNAPRAWSRSRKGTLRVVIAGHASKDNKLEGARSEDQVAWSMKHIDGARGTHSMEHVAERRSTRDVVRSPPHNMELGM